MQQCGADYVKTQLKLPTNFDSLPVGTRCASLDGDADRLVYFYPDGEGNAVLLDGDHISVLFTKFIMEVKNILILVQINYTFLVLTHYQRLGKIFLCIRFHFLCLFF